MAFNPQIGPQMYEMGASQFPGLNTMAGAYQQAQTTLGPSLLSYLASQKAHEDALMMHQETLKTNDLYRNALMSQKGDALLVAQAQKDTLMEQARQQKLASLMATQQGLEQAKTGTIGKWTGDKVKSAAYAKEVSQGKGFWGSGLGYTPPQADIDALAIAEYNRVNPAAVASSNQLQQVIQQQLAQGMLPYTQGGVPPTGTGAGTGQIKVIKIADGKLYMIPSDKFDPAKYTLA
jgi:hypothetical protein